MTPFRVMVFDQSASIRSLLKRTIEDAVSIECAGCHSISSILEKPTNPDSADVVIIGLEGNEMTRLPTLADSIARMSIPVVILTAGEEVPLKSSDWPEDCVILEKPRTARAWEDLCSSLVPTLENAGKESRSRKDRREGMPGAAAHGLDLVAVGGSAGGPEATGEMLQSIGEALERTAVVIVQHIGAGFEDDYVQWLRRMLPWAEVGIARDSEPLAPGRIRMAGPEGHLEISEGPVWRLNRESPPVHGHRPSVDHLFHSLARVKPAGSAGVLLSGMGMDGVEGLLSLRRAGGLTFVQDEGSSTVYGMPGSAIKRGAASIAQPPVALGTLLRRQIERGRGL